MKGPALSGRVIVVPAARVEQNVLADILARRGATVRTFPALRGLPPRDGGALEQARARETDWLIFSGELSVEHFHSALPPNGRRAAAKVAAIGVGARRALEARGVEVDRAPPRHTAEAVVSALGPVRGLRVTLLRSDRATEELPRALRSAGASVLDVAGYHLEVETGREALRRALQPPVELAAFGNPTAVRTFAAALAEAGADPAACLASVVVAAVGPATALACQAAGLPADLVAEGHLADLVLDLERLVGP